MTSVNCGLRLTEDFEGLGNGFVKFPEKPERPIRRSKKRASCHIQEPFSTTVLLHSLL